MLFPLLSQQCQIIEDNSAPRCLLLTSVSVVAVMLDSQLNGCDLTVVFTSFQCHVETRDKLSTYIRVVQLAACEPHLAPGRVDPASEAKLGFYDIVKMLMIILC